MPLQFVKQTFILYIYFKASIQPYLPKILKIFIQAYIKNTIAQTYISIKRDKIFQYRFSSKNTPRYGLYSALKNSKIFKTFTFIEFMLKEIHWEIYG